MTQAPFEYAGSFRVGIVDFVSPDEIKVTLDVEAPDSVALNASVPRSFPRVNGYLLVSVDEAFLVGQVEWLAVERSPFPKRRGMQDFGLVDLPFPLRRLRLNPLGTLRSGDGVAEFEFRRGADALPSVGSAVILPTERQLRSIVESGTHRRVKIGSSPLAGDAEVAVDPNRLFGRHFAVLGNTGSGKSCSVAGIVRWCLEQADAAQSAHGMNARFVILDPNGEYARAFRDDSLISAKVFRVDAGDGEVPLKVPLWFWNSAEWSSFTQASARTQRPLLRRALREVKAGKAATKEQTVEERHLGLRRYLSSRLITIQRDLRSGAIASECTRFGFQLKAMASDMRTKLDEFPDYGLDSLLSVIVGAGKSNIKRFEKNGEKIEYFIAFDEGQVNAIIESLNACLSQLGGIVYPEGPDEDVPVPFRGTDLADHLEILAEQENVTQFVDFLVARIRMFLSDPKMKAVIDDSDGVSLNSWLEDYLGTEESEDASVSIIDLSLVPTEVIHVVTAVIARIVFEALQRYVRVFGVTLPTVLVMEEAHTFVKRYREDIENQDASSICCQVFERIAREGRKFGLGLVLSSQRPSELSPTVLSQCNTFLLHRISNDRDQELVHRLVPDSLRGLLRELPSLPSQAAILLGWASQLPVMVRMNDLPDHQQPRSSDPDFWGVWLRLDKRREDRVKEVSWEPLVREWQSESSEPSQTLEEDVEEGC